MADATNAPLPSEAPVTPPAAPLPGTPEYDAAMAAKFDGGSTPQAATRPENIPEKFWDAATGTVKTEDLIKSYQELEKKLPTAATAQTPPAVTLPVTPDPAAATPDAAKEALAAKGLDMGKFATEFQTNGTLSPETYAAIEAAGFGKEVVDAYIAGQQALANQRDQAGYEVAGGKENFSKMVTWAAANMSVEERQAFNKAVAGTDAEMKLAISGLRAQYEAVNGKEPQLQGGIPSTAAAGYESKAQMTADMRDPRYAKDPAFRAKVEAKLAVTTAF